MPGLYETDTVNQEIYFESYPETFSQRLPDFCLCTTNRNEKIIIIKY